MENIGDRICRVRRDRKLSQSDIADALGISTRTYQRFEKNPEELDRIRQVASLLDVSYDWLLTGKDNNDIAPIIDNSLSVSLYRGGAGEGIYNFESSKYLLSLNTDIFPELKGKPITAIEVVGDSMEPILRKGDYILVTPQDRERRTEDGIYAIRLDGAIKIKALQFQLDGTIKIISYNHHYSSEIYDPAVSQVDFEILGKHCLTIAR